MTEQNDYELYEFLRSLPDRLQTFKKGVPLAVQQAYLDYHHQIETETISASDVAPLTRRLLDPATSPAAKKRHLFALAHVGTVAACQAIDRFLTATTTDAELRDWATLALEECWLLVESILFDEPRGMVISGLGGDGNRLRYFCVLEISETHRPAATAEQQAIERTFAQGCREHNSILEEIHFQDDYVTLQILIPQDVAVADVIETGISASNQHDNILDSDYFVTNVEIPTPEMIRNYLQRAKTD